jgi:Protein of unknown function, DUF547
MTTKRIATFIIASCAMFYWAGSVFAQGFDHGYAGWDAQLKKQVKWLPDNKQSRVNYKGFATDRAELTKTLEGFSAVTPAQYAAFSKEQQMAFLINAYNAFTIELILSKYPDVKSIKDLGSTFGSPWKKSFFKLLGEERNLDWIAWPVAGSKTRASTSPSCAPALAALRSRQRLLRRPSWTANWTRAWPVL